MESNQYLIGEFSKATGVSKRMLRHFDKMELLSPSHIDDFNGYRYYDSEQIMTVNKVKHLQGFGFTLKTIKNLINEPLAFDEFLSLLKDQEAILRNDTDEMVHHLLKLKQFISYVEANPTLEGDDQLKEFQVEGSLPMDKYQVIKEEIQALPSSSIFFEKIGEHCKSANISHVHFITFDTDDFMKVNDNYGFDVGDKVIYINYDIIHENFKDLLDLNAYNSFTRLGGDEFSLFLVNADTDVIKEKVNKSIDAIRTFDYSQIGCMSNITVSSGIAKVNEIVHPMQFRHLSTKALLSAKRSGRDCYEFIET